MYVGNFLLSAKSIANAVQTHLCALRYDASWHIQQRLD